MSILILYKYLEMYAQYCIYIPITYFSYLSIFVNTLNAFLTRHFSTATIPPK